ncbi:MAG: extracellular solute-binding protein [Clostridiales bacterium]|nr:extracellular solute-binding protein [Clostridiales bacterium]
MKKALSIVLVSAMALGLAACSSDSGSTSTTAAAAADTEAAQEAAEDTAEEAEATEAQEGGSGKLVIYSPNSDTQIEAQLNTFMEKYPGIEVELQSMGTGDVLARLEAEKENPQADLNWGAVNYVYYTQHPDLWEEYVSPNEELVDDNYKNDTGYFTNSNLSGSGCFILNNTLLEELGVEVHGYADLLQPELKGKIAMGDPTASSSAWAELTNMLLVMGGYDSDEAWTFIENFIQNLDGIILSSSSQVYKTVIDGEYAVGVSYEDPCVQAIIDNKDNPDADLSIVYPEEGAVWLPAGTAIVKNAPNMENAKLFVDWLQSEECQEILATTTIRGTITTIPQDNEYMVPLDDINVAYEDIEYCAEKQTEWLERWTDILTSY